MGKSGNTQDRKVASPRKATKGGRGIRRKSARKVPQGLGNQKGGVPNVRIGDKVGGMIVMLCRDKGASIEELSKAAGWQAHSVRAAISATIKKKLGLDVQSEKVGGVRRYRVNDRAGS
jgi:Protein of unknown function (DUF3489)